MKKLLCLLLTLFCVTAYAQVDEEAAFDKETYEGKLAVWFFALPMEDHSGESILIRTPNGETLLVDGGVPEVGAQVNAYLDRLQIDSLSAVIATHMHIDHVGGLAAVLDAHKAQAVYTSPLTNYQTTPVESFKAAVARQGLTATALHAGDSLTLDGVTLTVLSPFQSETEPTRITEQVLNDSSLVFLLEFGQKRLLFCGDATRAVEAQLIETYGENLRADLIKVPHHGSPDASTKAFVEAVGAKNSVICLYAFNDFNVYDRYKRVGNKPYVTSLDGTVVYVTDGTQEEILTCKERKGKI